VLIKVLQIIYREKKLEDALRVKEVLTFALSPFSFALFSFSNFLELVYRRRIARRR